MESKGYIDAIKLIRMDLLRLRGILKNLRNFLVLKSDRDLSPPYSQRYLGWTPAFESPLFA